jgi:Ketopantoate reductase PanE/ApbA
MERKYSLGKRYQIIFLIPIAGTLLESSHSWTIPGLSRPNVSSYPFVSVGNPTVHESVSSLWCSKTLADPEKSAALVPTILTTTIAIVGTGAVGGYYGSRLWEAGYNVKFHLRGDHYLHCTIHGLSMTVSKTTKNNFVSKLSKKLI